MNNNYFSSYLLRGESTAIIIKIFQLYVRFIILLVL